MKIHPDAHEGHLTVGDLTVPFHDTVAEGDTRETVVLIHGTGGTSSTHFRTLFPMLAAKHRVLAIDLQSDHGQLSLENLSSQVMGVVSERAAGPAVHVVGYSLGAVVAAEVAASHPESVASLTLIAGWVAADTQQKLRNSIWRRLHETDQNLLREFATWTSYGHPFLAARSDTEVRQIVESRVFPTGMAEQMELNRTVDLGDTLARIAAPTLVVAGSHDQMVPARQSQLLYGGIADARYAVIDSGHAIPLERPAQLFQLVHAFVSDPAATPSGTVHEHVYV